MILGDITQSRRCPQLTIWGRTSKRRGCITQEVTEPCLSSPSSQVIAKDPFNSDPDDPEGMSSEVRRLVQCEQVWMLCSEEMWMCKVERSGMGPTSPTPFTLPYAL